MPGGASAKPDQLVSTALRRWKHGYRLAVLPASLAAASIDSDSKPGLIRPDQHIEMSELSQDMRQAGFILCRED